jgi:uncharacterized protein (DUF169 family)
MSQAVNDFGWNGLPDLNKEAIMDSIKGELAIFNKFNFERPPVGVKFLFNRPEGVERLGKDTSFCGMLKEAQLGKEPFYAEPQQQSCKPGAYVWGAESQKVFESGLFGVGLKVFKDARADIRIHQHVKRLDKNIVRYISFSPLDQLSFDPDLLIVMTDSTSQAEIILRAMTYTTGEKISSKMTFVMGCSWILVYPYLTGQVNYVISGMGSGIKANKVFPPGRQIISMPYNWLPTITRNLREMEWVLPLYTEQTAKVIEKIKAELGLQGS